MFITLNFSDLHWSQNIFPLKLFRVGEMIIIYCQFEKKTHGLERPGPITKTVQVFVKSPQFQSVLMAKNTNFSSGFTPVGHNLHYHPGNCFRFWQNKTVAICFRLFDRIDHYDRFPIVQYPNMYWICLVQCT